MHWLSVNYNNNALETIKLYFFNVTYMQFGIWNRACSTGLKPSGINNVPKSILNNNFTYLCLGYTYVNSGRSCQLCKIIQPPLQESDLETTPGNNSQNLQRVYIFWKNHPKSSPSLDFVRFGVLFQIFIEMFEHLGRRYQ